MLIKLYNFHSKVWKTNLPKAKKCLWNFRFYTKQISIQKLVRGEWLPNLVSSNKS